MFSSSIEFKSHKSWQKFTDCKKDIKLVQLSYKNIKQLCNIMMDYKINRLQTGI